MLWNRVTKQTNSKFRLLSISQLVLDLQTKNHKNVVHFQMGTGRHARDLKCVSPSQGPVRPRIDNRSCAYKSSQRIWNRFPCGMSFAVSTRRPPPYTCSCCEHKQQCYKQHCFQDDHGINTKKKNDLFWLSCFWCLLPCAANSAVPVITVVTNQRLRFKT